MTEEKKPGETLALGIYLRDGHGVNRCVARVAIDGKEAAVVLTAIGRLAGNLSDEAIAEIVIFRPPKEEKKMGQ